MATQKLAKKLPKRASMPQYKVRRAASYSRGVASKAKRVAEQKQRETANREYIATTPHGMLPTKHMRPSKLVRYIDRQNDATLRHYEALDAE